MDPTENMRGVTIYHLGPFADLLSLKDAAYIWDIDASALRKAIARGDLIEGIDVMKFGRQWVITVRTMEQITRKSITEVSFEKTE